MSGQAPSSNAGKLKWAIASSNSRGSTNVVDRLARLDNGTCSVTDSTVASIKPSAAAITRSLAAILSSSAPRNAAIATALVRRDGRDRNVAQDSLVEQGLTGSGPVFVKPAGL